MTYNLKENLRFLLSVNNINQSELGDLIGSSGKTVSNWINGVANTPLEKLILISKEFDIPLDTMVFGYIGPANEQMNQFVKENHPELYKKEKGRDAANDNIELVHLRELVKAKDDTIASLKMTNELLKTQVDELKREMPTRLPKDNGSNSHAS